MSPTDFCNNVTTCGQPNPGSPILAGTEAMTSFRFCRAPDASLRRLGHGASRATSSGEHPGAGSSRLPGFAQPRYVPRRSPERESTCTGRRTKRRMRPFVPRVLGLVTRCPRFDCVSRRHSPPWRPPDIRCRRCGGRRGRKPAARSSDRPRPVFQRRSAKSAAFRQARMPFTVSTHEGIVVRRRDCSLRPSCRLSRSRRPHLALRRGRCFSGIARSRCGHPRVP
jgi:hypothetical protein